MFEISAEQRGSAMSTALMKEKYHFDLQHNGFQYDQSKIELKGSEIS